MHGQGRGYGRFHDGHIKDATLVERVADAGFLALVKVEQVVVFIGLGGAHQILLIHRVGLHLLGKHAQGCDLG